MKQKLLFFTVMALAGSLLISCTKDAVIPAPTITSFTPTDGAVEESVTITGTNFSATAASNIVLFNGTAAVVTASTTTSITTTVPAGATTGTITVTVGTQKATSATSFRVDALFKATMLGANEPAPNNTSTGTGSAKLTFNLETKIFTIVSTYTGLTGAATNAHIHKGVAGVAGAVVFPFASPFTSPINYTSVALTPAQEIDLNAGSYYVNIHSAAFPGGEIRGFLIKQ